MTIFKSSHYATLPYYKDKGLAYIIIAAEPDKVNIDHVNPYAIAKCFVKADEPRSINKEQFFEILHFMDLMLEENKDINGLVIHHPTSFDSFELCTVLRDYTQSDCTVYMFDINKTLLAQYNQWVDEYKASKQLLLGNGLH